MEMRQLRYFVAIAESQQFTRAAQQLHLAQPALSQQIRALEQELGAHLFERTPHGVILTQAGTLFLPRARQILSDAASAVEEQQRLAGLEIGRLTLGVTPTRGALDLARVLAEFHDENPHVELAVREDLSLVLCDLLRAGEADLALMTAVGESEMHGLELRRHSSQRLVCIVAPRHPLAGRPAVSTKALARERLAVFRRGATITTQLQEHAAARALELPVAFEADDLLTMRELVVTGLAVAVLPAGDAARLGEGIAVVPLRESALRHEVFVAWRRGRSLPAAAARFAELVEADARLHAP